MVSDIHYVLSLQYVDPISNDVNNVGLDLELHALHVTRSHVRNSEWDKIRTV